MNCVQCCISAPRCWWLQLLLLLSCCSSTTHETQPVLPTSCLLLSTLCCVCSSVSAPFCHALHAVSHICCLLWENVICKFSQLLHCHHSVQLGSWDCDNFLCLNNLRVHWSNNSFHTLQCQGCRHSLCECVCISDYADEMSSNGTDFQRSHS